MHSTGPCPAAAGQLGLVRAHENESMRRLELIFRYAWTSPATAIGLVFSVLAMLAGARPRMVNGVLEVAGGHFVASWPFSHAALALPRSPSAT